MEREEWQERMGDLFREDLPLISEMIRATESKIIVYPIYDIRTQPLWSRERVVLVGDAIHAISPNAGQGASLALEDAIVRPGACGTRRITHKRSRPMSACVEHGSSARSSIAADWDRARSSPIPSS